MEIEKRNSFFFFGINQGKRCEPSLSIETKSRMVS